MAEILCLPQPEWLPHELTVTGSAAELAAFRSAAAGPGFVAWRADHDRMEEDWVHAMLAPSPAARDISLDGARILARQLREALERQDGHATKAAFGGAGCPLDLNALLPIPGPLLRLGPDDPATLAWLWEHWGTTWPLRGVEALPPDPAARPPKLTGGVTPGDGGVGAVRFRFWSADWGPWRAVAAMRDRWPCLTFQVRVRGVAE